MSEAIKKLTIRVELDNRPYRIIIDNELEEEHIRAGVKYLNEKITSLKKKFETTQLDYLALAAIDVATNYKQTLHKLDYNIDKIQIEEIEKKINDFLSK